MIQDISFCGSDCDKTYCFRHPSNIINIEYPHSFAFFKGTDICKATEEISRKDLQGKEK